MKKAENKQISERMDEGTRSAGALDAAYSERRAKAAMEVLRAALWGEEYKPEKPDEVKPSEIFEDLKLHTVAALPNRLVQEVCRLGGEGELQPVWMRYSMQTAVTALENLEAIGEITELLGEAGIKPVILKGMAAAIYYPVPEIRTPGDVDFIVPPEDFDRAEQILEENGYNVEKKASYTRHDRLTKDGVEFEFHRYFTYLLTAQEKRLEEMLAKGVADPECAEINGTKFYMLPPLENGLCLLEHLRHHIFTGLGLRQVSDWLKFAGSVADENFWNNEFCPALEKTQLKKLAAAVTLMGEKYMGLPHTGHNFADAEADEALADDLFKLAWTNGNFGRKFNTDGKSYLGNVNSFRKRPLNYISRAAKSHTPKAAQNPWLMPHALAKLPFHYAGLLIKRGGGTERIKKELEISNEQREILKKLDIGAK